MAKFIIAVFLLLLHTCLAYPPASGGNCFNCARANFRLMNNYRSRTGAPPLRWSGALAQRAIGHSRTMYNSRSTFHSCTNCRENVASSFNEYSWPRVAAGFFNKWKNSSGHNSNMLNRSARCVGIAIYGNGARYYATQLFSNTGC